MIKTEKESPYFKAKKCLQDLIAHDLKVLFVSGPPSVSTLKSGHHFANETSPFWQSLLDCGLIDDRLRNYQENKLIKSYRLGITTLNTNQLTLTESADTKSRLTKMIQMYCPRAVCFIGKDVFEYYSMFDCTEFGSQTMTIPWPRNKGQTLTFVIPKPNSRVTSDHDKVIYSTYFDELSLLAKLQDLKYPKVDATAATTITIDDTHIKG